MKKKAIISLLMALLPCGGIYAQRDSVALISANKQRNFPDNIPAGNYSGIVSVGNGEYAVVSDKSTTDGFFIFAIDIDSISGDIRSIENRGFKSSSLPNRDGEGITYLPSTKTILISGEADGKILEYDLSGQRTVREAAIPEVFSRMRGNLGFESLTYSAANHLLWTCNESTIDGDGEVATATNGVRNVVRVQSFDEALQPQKQYAYRMDAPVGGPNSWQYAMGVPALAALDDGSLLVLEREFYVPQSKLGAFVNCKIYQAWPSEGIDGQFPITAETAVMDKNLIYEWRTSLGLFNHAVANYEGMCLGPRLSEGRQVLLLVADSQNQYAGVLKDWFKSIVIKVPEQKPED